MGSKRLILGIMASNIIVKGFMKSLGIILRKLHQDWPMSETMFSLSPSTLHLVFNTSGLVIPFLAKRYGFVKLELAGILCIAVGVGTLPHYSQSTGPIFQMILIGIGAGSIYHINTIITNAITSCPGLFNGLLTGANSLGGILAICTTAFLFRIGLELDDTMIFLSTMMLVVLLPCLYNTQSHLEKFEKEVQKIRMENWRDQFYPKKLHGNILFYLLCVTQSLNGVGFLNFTNYLGITIDRTGVEESNLAYWIYITFNVSDCICRFAIPPLVDSYPWAKDFLYSIGCVGGGLLMMSLPTWNDPLTIHIMCAAMGFFTSLFISMWSTQLKSYVNNKMFQVMYTQSVAVTGVVNFGVVTLLIWSNEEDGEGKSNPETIDFSMQAFGLILTLSAVSMLAVHYIAKIWPSMVTSMWMEEDEVIQKTDEGPIAMKMKPTETIDGNDDQDKESTSTDEGIEDPSIRTCHSMATVGTEDANGK